MHTTQTPHTRYIPIQTPLRAPTHKPVAQRITWQNATTSLLNRLRLETHPSSNDTSAQTPAHQQNEATCVHLTLPHTAIR